MGNLELYFVIFRQRPCACSETSLEAAPWPQLFWRVTSLKDSNLTGGRDASLCPLLPPQREIALNLQRTYRFLAGPGA